MTEIQEKANNMAKEAGFDFAKYIGKKGIFNVYCCDFDSDEVACTGLPIFLLECDGEIKYANDNETPSLMDMLSEEE